MIKRIISAVLTVAMMLSVIGGIGLMNERNVYARKGVDIYGNPVTHNDIYQPTDDPVYYYQPPVDENGNHDYFGYPMYGDPMDIADEEFFGIWDEYTNMWSVSPKFRYYDYPDMAAVEAAAKVGDYETAKYELREYFKGVTMRGDTTATSAPSAKYPVYMEALSKNVYAYAYISSESVGYFTAPADEFAKVELDVLAEVNSARGSYQELNLALAGVDKYYTTTQIYSNQASDPSLRPILRMNLNGVIVDKPVTKDNMIVAGTEENINYGFDEIMEIQEHGGYDNINYDYGTFDEDTKRAFVAFDISELKSTDTITSAKVIFTCRTIITDETRRRFADENGNPYAGKARPKDIWAVWYRSSAWGEDELTWASDVVADKHYFSYNDQNAWDYISSNSTTYKGKVCQYHRSGMIQNITNSYAYYGDERFAYTSIRQQMALINSLGLEINVMNDLDIATHLSGNCAAFYKVLSSKYFTPEVCTAYLKFIWQMTDDSVERIYGRRDNNWATYATGGVYRSIAYFPEFAQHDYWYQATLDENSRCLSGQTFEDGLCIEVSQSYISTILDTYDAPMEVYMQTGHPAPFSEELYEEIHNIVKSGIYTSGGPKFSGFGQADSNDGAGKTSKVSLYRFWYESLFPDDEEIAYLATNGVIGRLPENPTTVYPVGLKTIMRSSWDGTRALQLSFINNSDSRASHYHYDALSFAMFAYGEYLLVDPAYGSDQTSDNGGVWQYNKSPVQHNMVTVNDTYDYLNDGIRNKTSLARDSSWARDFETNKYYDYQDYLCNGYSNSNEMSRSIVFMKDQKFWIVSDFAEPKDPTVENVFAQHWHMYPGANQTVDENFAVKSNFDGVNVMVVPLEEGTVDDYQFVDCYYSEKSGQKMMNKKTMLLNTRTGNGKFTTLILPVDIGENFEVFARSIENTNEGIDDSQLNMSYFSIKEKKTGDISYYYYFHNNKPDTKPEGGIKVADFTTDATTFVIETDKNDEIISVFMVNGSYIKNDNVEGGYVVKTNEPTTISYKKSGQFVTVMASQFESAEDLEGIQIYMPSAKAAILDETEVGVNIENSVVTFDGTYNSSNISSGAGNGGGSAGGSAGGGGGGDGAVTPKPTVKEEDKTEEDVKPVEPSVKPATPSYEDVKATDWYFGYVETLSEKGIVSGDGTGNFNPNANVTREQFLKMLVEVVNIETEECENTFTDVANAWYKPYVLKAKNFGIVNGISDTEFGIGSNITRQDMAVMISRTIEKLGIETEKTDVNTFADDGKVSDYAKEAVLFMKSIGIIEGNNNEFRPIDNLTRAEASKVIYELLQYVGTTQ